MAATSRRPYFMAKVAIQLELSSKSLRAIMPTNSDGMESKPAWQRVAGELGFVAESGRRARYHGGV